MGLAGGSMLARIRRRMSCSSKGSGCKPQPFRSPGLWAPGASRNGHRGSRRRALSAGLLTPRKQHRIDRRALLPNFYPMITLTVSAKGQVTLRKEVLKHLGIGPGEQINVAMLPDGRIEVRAASTGEISSLFGMLSKKGRRPLSIDEINEITKQGWSGKIAGAK